MSGKGISTNPKKVEAVAKWPTPQTVYDVRSFLGFVGYYRRFIKNFSKIAKPIREVITGLENQSKRSAKKTFVEWTEAADSAFEHLKKLCISTPILAYPDYKLPFVLHTDSSSEGLGAVLYQKQNGKLRVIAYASRSVSKAESRYPAHKLEFLALKWAICEKFHEYLYGSNLFEVYTDNNPLTYVLSSAKLDACGQRWVAKLANYNFTVKYKCGLSNVEADGLSRISWPEILAEAEDLDVDLNPQGNGQCERFNSTLCNMLGTLSEEEKSDWKSYLGCMTHAYNCTKHASTTYSPYYLMFGRHPRLPIDVEFGLLKSNSGDNSSKSRYVQKLRRRLNYAFQKATKVANQQASKYKSSYDKNIKGPQLQEKDLVLVKIVAHKGRHKLQDKWEPEEYVVVEQPIAGTPVYRVQPVTGEILELCTGIYCYHLELN